MAFCRFSKHSDVYVYESIYGPFTCCGCILAESSFYADTAVEMIDHLRQHEQAGHEVPAHAFERLQNEASIEAIQNGFFDLEAFNKAIRALRLKREQDALFLSKLSLAMRA